MKRLRMSIFILIALIFGLALFWLVSTSRAATETPAYRVVRTEGKFELRDYPALTVATTPMESGEMNRGFGQLFRFITGSNEGAQKIKMTAPVLVDKADGRKTMSFIMPKETVAKGVPKPAGESVTVETMKAARFAVLRFGGGRTAENENRALERLRVWLAGQKIAAKGDPIFAYYDPPWTPLFLRRNEVMLRIEG